MFLAIAAPWHILAARANPTQIAGDGTKLGFLWFYFVNEQFLRYLGKRVPAGYDTVPLLIFWALTILWLAPWMVFLAMSWNLLYQFWIHTERISRMPRWFEFVFNTPSHHRVEGVSERGT